MASQPSQNIPKAPDPAKSYEKGIQVYLKYLPKLLGAEMENRYKYDPERLQWQQDLQDKFGPKQYQQMLESLKAIDPTGYNLREAVGSKIFGNLESPENQAYYNEFMRNAFATPQNQELYNQLLAGVSGDLKAGSKLTPDQEQALEQEIRRSQGRTGNSYGQAAVQAEAFTKGKTGLDLWQQRLANAQSVAGMETPGERSLKYQGLALSTASPTEKAIQSAINFQNAATPEQWLSAIPPVSPDRSSAYVNPNSGYQGQQFALQNYQNMLAQTQLSQQGQGSNPWMSALSGAASGALAGTQFSPGYGTAIGAVIGGLYGGLGSAFSDRRLKSNIVRVSELANGLGVYDFDMFGRRYRGVIADEVQQVVPDAVTTDAATGFKVVDYSKVGIPMEILQ